MTCGGWLIMLASVGGMTAWLGWCVYKATTTPDETERLHGFEPRDQPPGDTTSTPEP